MRTKADVKALRNSVLAKAKRYNWTMRDNPGEFKLIHKKDLLVDKQYQRDSNDFKILNIAKDWSWVACGVLIVARRKKDLLFVVDGQHRKFAADKREEITTLPCMIFDTEEVAEEASGFLLTNVNRRPLSSVDKFVALVVTKEPSAVLANELIAADHRKVADYSYATTCNIVGAIVKCIDTDRDALLRVWPLYCKLCEGKAMTANLLQAMFFLERKLLESKNSLLVEKWKNRCLVLGEGKLRDSMRESKIYHNKGGEKICAIGLVKAINQGQRVKLPIELTP